MDNSFKYKTISDALKRAAEQRVFYERNLIGKRILYFYLDNSSKAIEHKEVMFEEKNYLHLTGLDYKYKQQMKRAGQEVTSTDAQEFYNRLKNNDPLLIEDVSFIESDNDEERKRYYRYTQYKLDNLSQLSKIADKAEYIGKYEGNQRFDIIVNRNNSSIAFVKNKTDDVYFPMSSLYGNANTHSSNANLVLAIFCKEKDDDIFCIKYLNAKAKIGKALFSTDYIHLPYKLDFSNPQVKFNEKSLSEFIHSYELSIRKCLQQELNKIANYRKDAFGDEIKMNIYLEAFNSFCQLLDSEQKVKIALELLQQALKEDVNNIRSDENKEGNNLIIDEYNEIHKRFPDIIASEPLSNIFLFQHNPFPGFDGAIVKGNSIIGISIEESTISAPLLPPKKSFEILYSKIKNAVKDFLSHFHRGDKDNKTGGNPPDESGGGEQDTEVKELHDEEQTPSEAPKEPETPVDVTQPNNSISSEQNTQQSEDIEKQSEPLELPKQPGQLNPQTTNPPFVTEVMCQSQREYQHNPALTDNPQPIKPDADKQNVQKKVKKQKQREYGDD